MNFGKGLPELQQKIKGINREEITKIINNIPQGNAELKEKLTYTIDNLIADYNIMLAYYNKKYYKQGFEDAKNIMKICDK